MRILLYNLFFIFFGIFAGWSQSCNFLLSGIVTDEDSGKELELAQIYLQETNQGVVSLKDGSYAIDNICKGTYHLIISHLGCVTQKRLLHIDNNTVLNISLEHHNNKLDHVVVTAHNSETLQESLNISKEKIEDNLNESLGQLTEKITGVSAFKNGTAISKPIIHGLYGNRVGILNNGVSLAGQQWGIDHAPEIDPQAADKITVIKGVGAVKYPGPNLGGVVLVEPSPIEKEPHLHGRTNFFLESNGIGTGVSGQLQQYKGFLGWKVTGTLRNSGDRRAPDFYLNNTGYRQQNLSLQLQSQVLKRWQTAVNVSFYNAKIGILRGALSTLPNDLERVLTLPEPQFTESSHSFGIEAPRQEVRHWFGKWENKFSIGKGSKIKTSIAYQFNQREEFDNRRGGRTDNPTLDLEQKSYQIDGIWKKKWNPTFKSEIGGQHIYADNTNFVTDVRRLIPDYIRNNYGAFGILKVTLGDFDTEIGARISREKQNVVTNRPQEDVMRFSDVYFNTTYAFGLKYQPKETAYHLNIGYVNRNPTIDERFSDGVHVGVASYERGNRDLVSEKSFKITTGVDAHITESISVNLLGYYQRFQDYIYLEPSGLFNNFFLQLPFFEYQQTSEAIFTGFDISLGYEISPRWSVNAKGSYLWAQDESNNEPVINAPANNIGATIGYNLLQPVSFLGEKWNNVSFKLDHNYTFQQKRFPTLENFPEFPFPPEAYYVLGARIEGEVPFKKSNLRLVLRGNNLLNNSYRDYLNRLRLYAADEEGVNIVLNATLTF